MKAFGGRVRLGDVGELVGVLHAGETGAVGAGGIDGAWLSTALLEVGYLILEALCMLLVSLDQLDLLVRLVIARTIFLLVL